MNATGIQTTLFQSILRSVVPTCSAKYEGFEFLIGK
jgi:hypothetical protein